MMRIANHGALAAVEHAADAAAESPRSLNEAAADFEGLLWNELFKAMRKTTEVPGGKSDFGQQIYTGMLDEALAQAAADTGSLGLAGSIAQQLGAQETSAVRDTLGERTREVSALARRLGEGHWVRPVAAETHGLSRAQRFGGPREGDRPDECGAGHCGIDLALDTGEPVRAANSGTVVAVQRDDVGRAGRWVEIDHGEGLRSRYLHLDAISPALQPGDALEAGALVGTVGATGTSAHGAHLHFELVHHGKYIDPTPHLSRWRVLDREDRGIGSSPAADRR